MRRGGGEDRGRASVPRHLAAQVGGHDVGGGVAHRRAIGMDFDRQPPPRHRARRRLPLRHVTHLAGRPAHEVRQGDLRLFEGRIPALLPLEGDPAVVPAGTQGGEDPFRSELPVTGKSRHPAAPLRSRLARHVLEVDVPNVVAEDGQALRGRFAHLEGVRGIPEDADSLRPPGLQHAEGVPGLREVAVRLDPDLHAVCARDFSEAGQSLRDPAPRGLPILPRLDAIAEHADAGSVQARRQLDRPRGLLDGCLARRRLRMMEERARVDAGDREPGVAQARRRLAQARAGQLRTRPQRVIALEESELHAVVAQAAGGVDHRGQGPGRTAEGREAELHVILRSMEALTRLRTGHPRKKRSRSSSTRLAIARRTSRWAAPT